MARLSAVALATLCLGVVQVHGYEHTNLLVGRTDPTYSQPTCKTDKCALNLADSTCAPQAASFCPKWLSGEIRDLGEVPAEFSDCDTSAKLTFGCNCATGQQPTVPPGSLSTPTPGGNLPPPPAATSAPAVKLPPVVAPTSTPVPEKVPAPTPTSAPHPERTPVQKEPPTPHGYAPPAAHTEPCDEPPQPKPTPIAPPPAAHTEPCDEPPHPKPTPIAPPPAANTEPCDEPPHPKPTPVGPPPSAFTVPCDDEPHPHPTPTPAPRIPDQTTFTTQTLTSTEIIYVHRCPPGEYCPPNGGGSPPTPTPTVGNPVGGAPPPPASRTPAPSSNPNPTRPAGTYPIPTRPVFPGAAPHVAAGHVVPAIAAAAGLLLALF